MKTRIIQFLAAFIFLAVTVSLQAQQEEGGMSFGIRAGVNFQNINGKDENGDKLENDLATRFHAGVQVDLPIAPEFYIQPGVLFTMKGAKTEERILEQTVNGDISLSYIEVPVNFLYKPMLGSGHLLLGIGPYFAFGIGGKGKYESGGVDTDFDVNFQNDVGVDDDIDALYFRPMDIGGNLLFGYQFAGGLFVQLNAQLGLTKINPNYDAFPDDDSSFQNTGFGFSVGYGF